MILETWLLDSLSLNISKVNKKWIKMMLFLLQINKLFL